MRKQEDNAYIEKYQTFFKYKYVIVVLLKEYKRRELQQVEVQKNLPMINLHKCDLTFVLNNHQSFYKLKL